MLSNSQVKHINALKNKKFRDEYGEFIAEGNTLVSDLINSPYEIAGVYAQSEWIGLNLDVIRQKNIAVYKADQGDMERITSLSSPSPVLAIVKIPAGLGLGQQGADAVSADHIPGLFTGLSLVLEGISDPGNMGTLLRIADWFGIRNVICSENCVELFNPKVVQASMGSVARVRVFYTELTILLDQIKGKLPVYGTFLQGDSIYSVQLENRGLILIGSEAHGVSDVLSGFVTGRLYIPSFGSSENGKAESLNAAVAAAVVISEFRRRGVSTS